MPAKHQIRILIIYIHGKQDIFGRNAIQIIDSLYSYPAPITWVKSLQDPEKWNVAVKAFGEKVMHMGPLTLGTQIKTDDMEFLNRKVIWPDNVSDYAMSAQQWAKLTKSEQDVVKNENARRKRTRDILSKITDLTPDQPDVSTQTVFLMCTDQSCAWTP